MGVEGQSEWSVRELAPQRYLRVICGRKALSRRPASNGVAVSVPDRAGRFRRSGSSPRAKGTGMPGTPEAVTATAHKLARIVYHLLFTKSAYDNRSSYAAISHEDTRDEIRFRKQAANLGYMLSPIPEV
jgi:hypothetical protein